MNEVLSRGPRGLSLLVGQSGEGLWIVRDAEGVCGAVFMSRDEALRFAREECEAAQPRPCEWRLVPALDLSSIFPRSAQAA